MRQISALKKKAAKTDVSDLMQIMMMQAYAANEDATSSSGASSSAEPWKPKNAKDAFEQIMEWCPTAAGMPTPEMQDDDKVDAE